MSSVVFDLIGRDTSARRALQRVADSADRTGKRLQVFGDNSSKALGKFTKAMAISSALATATVAAQGTGAAIGAIGAAAVAASGSLLLLPGAALAGATAFGALKIATAGFGDALKEMGDPEAFAEAIKELAPAAQESAKAIRDLKEPFDELADSLQEKLFAGLAAQIRDTGRALIDTLRPAFESVASSANTAISSVLSELSTLQSQLRIGLIADDAAGAFANLAAAARPVVDALLDIGAVGASLLPGLTAGAGAAAQSFADMIARMRESGQLAEIIQGGLDALSQLGQLLANIGSIIGSVFGAMQSAGGTTIGVLVALTGEFRNFLKSAEGQQVLTTIFTTLHDLVQALLPGVKALGGALVSAIMDIAPALPGIGEAFSSIAQSVAPLVETLGHLVGAILPPLVDVLTFLGPALGPLAGFIGALVVATKLWTAAQLLLNIALLANPIGIVIVALGALVAAVALVIKHWDKIKAATAAVWGFISGTVLAAIEIIKGKIAEGVAFVLGTMAALGALPGRVAAWFGGVKDAAIRQLLVLLSWLGGLRGKILSALGDLGSLLKRAGRAVIQGLIDGIMSMIGAVGRAIGSVTSKIRNALPFSPAKEGPLRIHPPDEAGRTVVDMIAAGLRQRLPQLEAAMGQLAGSISAPSAFPLLPPPVPGGGGSAPVVLRIESGGSRLDDLLVEALRNAVSIQGGDVQLVLGR